MISLGSVSSFSGKEGSSCCHYGNLEVRWDRSRDWILSQEVPATPPRHSVGLNVPAKADTENRKRELTNN